MELTPERKRSIRRRLEPLLAALDPELHFIEVILDSRRQNLGVVVQKADRPAMLRLDFVRYVSMPEAELRATLARQLQSKRLIAP
ncbi:MAG: hypothetical protein ACE5HL_01635 [Terriglobia bacterium]